MMQEILTVAHIPPLGYRHHEHVQRANKEVEESTTWQLRVLGLWVLGFRTLGLECLGLRASRILGLRTLGL